MNRIHIKTYHSPCGDMVVGSYEGRICLCDWAAGAHRDSVDRRLRRILNAVYEEGGTDVISEAERQLDDYFSNRLSAFDLPLLLVGTDFQKMVWNGLARIPYGTTVSYSELAGRIGSPGAVRAVANACGANALSIIVPCHRIVGADGSLTGYAGGLQAKRFLLNLENVILFI